jgi:hypothetical protein
MCGMPYVPVQQKMLPIKGANVSSDAPPYVGTAIFPLPPQKNGNLKNCKGRLLSQKSSAKGLPFEFRTSFFIYDSFFLIKNQPELQKAIAHLNSHFARFGLIMHLGNKSTNSKSECMYFPASLKDAKKQFEGWKKVHFINNFKYIGSTITTLLNEDNKVEARIRTAKSIMGASRHFFDNKDVNQQVKKEIYIA